MLVFATMIAPAARNLPTTGASTAAGFPSSARTLEPARVTSPATSKRSLMVTMAPSSGPTEIPDFARASAASAAALDCSRYTVRQARPPSPFGSSIRASAASSRSRAEFRAISKCLDLGTAWRGLSGYFSATSSPRPLFRASKFMQSMGAIENEAGMTTATRGKHSPPGQGNIYAKANEVIVKITGADTAQTFEVVEENCKPGFQSRAHYHIKAYETFYIFEGSADFQVGEDLFLAQKGSCVHIPPGVTHQVTSKEGVRMLMIYSPAGTEGMFAAMHALSQEELMNAELTKQLA